ncbi:MAG: hypothetical protein PUE26_08460 [Ruminococcus sp.]|nr:Ig-like domain-containing protein [Ruminococcus sp.]MDD6710164.1 hypothetical protein [Ruminococcus sp.]
MKEKIKRISSSTWALILAFMMAISSFSVLAATTNVNKTGAIYTGTLYYHHQGCTGDVKVYSFGGNYSLGNWDTKVMTPRGNGYYSVEVPSNSTDTKVIFHEIQYGSGQQTVDVEYDSDTSKNMFEVTGSNSDNKLTGSWTNYSATKEVASHVALSSDGGSGLKVGDTVTLTVTATTDITTSDITYTFTDSFDNSTKTVISGKTAQATFENLKAGTHNFTVTASKSGYTDKTSNEISVPVTGGSSSTNTIYFKDTVHWGSVFAYFYDADYNPDVNGCSGSKAKKKVTLNLVHGETDIYSYTFDSPVSYSKVCFTKIQQDDHGNFYDNVAAYREDLNFSSGETMYVPETTSSGKLNSNVPYYNNGAWEAYAPAPTMYNVETGVKLSTDGATYTESSGYTAPTGGGSVTSTTLTASDIEDYTFVGWETSNGDSITSTDKSVEYTPTSDVTVYAKYNKNYTITINNTVENGTVKVDSATTGKTVTAGTEVVFTATANEGYQFTAWTGALTGETSATVTKNVTNNMNVGATFSKAIYTITKADTSNGSFTVTSDSGAEITSAYYGDTVTVTPTPADGYKLDSVKYNDTTISAKDGKYTFTMPAGNVTVSVTFKSVPTYTIYGSIINSAWTVETGKQMTYDSVTGNYYYVVKDVNADSGRHFRLFSNNKDYGPDGEIDIPIKTTPTKMGSADKKKAYYINETALESGHVYTIYTDGQSVWYTDTQNKHNITVDTTTKNGSVTATPSTEAGAGATVTLTNTPNAGYTLNSYKVYKTDDESTTVNVNNGTFIMPDYDVTVTATFKKIDYTMTVSANPSALKDNVSVSKQTANIGDKVTFTAQDVEGYVFTGWTLTDATLDDTSSKEITVTVGTKNISATANYTVKNFNIEKSATLTNGSITVNANANYGEDVTFTITPNSGYQVVNGSVEVRKANGQTVTVTAGENGTYTFTMPASNVTISANFELAKYTITKPTTTDFTVTVDGDLAEATVGNKVSFTVAKAHEYAVLDKVTVTDASDKKVSLTKDGDKYTFTMPASNVTINVTSSTSSTGYGLVGSLNNWDTGANVFVKDSSSTSNYSYTTVDLTAGTYEFKVAHGVDWYTKANTTITSSSCTDIQFSINSSESANCSITVTEAGTYKFVWNTSTKKISVIYPNAKYYVVGRFMTSTYETSNWNPKDTNMPFTYDSETGYYKLETGKTIMDLSGVQTNTSSDAYYYFWLYDGGSYYQPSTSNTEFHNNDSSNKQNLVYTSNDNSQTLRFSNTSSTNTSPVTLWYDPVERQIWYEALSPVASVTLSAEEKTYYYGDSVNLTANVNDAKSNNLTYTFTEVDENGSEVSTPVTSDTNTVTFDNLTDGTHYYKVEVSAEGYKSVTATTSITVTKHDIATSVSLESLSQEVTYGNDVQVTATLNGKYEGYTGNVKYTLLYENGDAVSGVAPIETNQTNVVFTVTKPSTGHHTYKVSASAENYETVESNTVSVYVKQTDITSKVTLTGPIAGYEYKVGDSIELKASCEDAPEGVTVKYNYYINGKKINGSATPNKVTYDFTASDDGTVTFYAEAVADNYNTVESAKISAKVIMKQVATSVNLTATPTNVKFGNEVTITATLTGDVQPGNFTYTFKETNVNGDIKSVQSNNGSATITTSDLAVGTHNISVTVSGTNFESITSSEDLIVTVSEAYHDENVNATSGKTLLISYDTSTTSVRNYVHTWCDNGDIFNNKPMTAFSSISGLYYKDYTGNESLIGNNSINFIVKHGNGWEGSDLNSSGDKKPAEFKVGKQWYITTDNTNKEYTPLTFTKLNVPTEINDDDSTRFIFDVTGGLPYFFGKTVGTANDNAVYTVKITGPNGYEVTKTAKYYADTTQITLDKLTIPATGVYTFKVSDGIDEVSVIKTLEVTPLVVDNYNATVNPSDNATISVTYKDTTITGGNTGELPEKRNAIISVTGIKDGYKVKNVSVKSGTTEIPVTTQQYGTYLFTMPSSDVTIKVDVVEKSKYQVNFGISEKTNGSITATAGSTSINSGARIAEDTEVTFTVHTNSDDYVIDGWYSDASYENEIEGVDTSATTYKTTISETTNVYVKISNNPGKLEQNLRFVYGSNDNPANWTNVAYVYSKNDGSYYVKLDYTKLNKNTNYYYGLSGTNKTPLESANDLYWQNNNDTVTYSSTNSDAVTNEQKNGGYGVFNHFGFFVIKDTSNMFSLTMKITPNEDNNGGEYQIIPSVRTAPEGALEVYAKDGTLKTTSGYGDTTVSGMNVDCEGFEVDNGTYKQYAAMPGDRLTITTVVNDTQADQGWYVSNYVINGVGYDAISTVKALATVQAGSTGASYTIATPYSVTGKETKNIIEITPIYKNRNIEVANDYITLYANADSLGDAWGNTISVYAYYYKKSGSTDAYCMNSAYPGDPMMKTSSGLFVSYVPKHYWEASGSEMKMLNNTVSGITFNNYAEKETIHKKVLEGTHQLQNNQTYDYDDFKLIADAGYDTVLYDFKYYDNSTTNQDTLLTGTKNELSEITSPETIDPSVYENDANHNGWEVLTNMDNEEVSLLGYSARNASTIGGTFDNKNRLHIVSAGNIQTDMGVWSTVWFVYDKDNKFITRGIPSDFIPRLNSDGTESTTQTDAYKAIKAKGLEYTGAYITYESEMGAGSSTDTGNTGHRSDGRWYYSRAVDQVKVNTHVLYAGADKSDWKEDTYSSDYSGVTTGAKALVGTERTTSVDRNSEVSISASPLSKGTANKQYKFIGWTSNATKGEDGTYTIVKNPSMTDSSQTVKVSTNMDLYALYIPVAEGDLIITHEKYTGENAYGGPGRYFVQATLYNKDGDQVLGTYYQEGSVTIPNYTETSGKIDVQLIVYSVNGSRYKATYNYQNTAITDESHVDKVCSSGDPAVVAKSFTASQIFENGVMKTNKVAYYSDLQTNNITVKMNYYNRKVENGKPADMDSNPTSYSYRFTSYPEDVLKDGTLSIPDLIEYAKNHSQQPDNMIEKYISWNSQDDALKGIVKYTNYHTKTNDKYEATPYHTDQYGKVQKTGEKWVTYYDRNGVEVDEEDAKAETVSSISIWYFNTPKKYTYTLNTANSSSELGDNKDGTFYGTTTETASELFYNTRLFTSDREVSNAASEYTKAYGVEHGYTGQAINTAETIDNGGTTLKFLYWAYDKAGKKVASTNIQYGLRITNNTTLYAIYGEAELDAPGLTVQEVTPDTFFDSNNISKTRINTIFNPYNCKDNDKNIDSASVVYLRVASSATEKSLNNLNDDQLKELRTKISTVVSKASYEKFKSGTVDAEASQQIVQISGSTASGFKFKVVDAPSSSSTQLQTSLSNKNRGQFTTTFTTSTLKNYTYYVFATMGYKGYNGTDASVVTGSDGISYITSDNFAKYDFDKDGKYYVPSSNS